MTTWFRVTLWDKRAETASKYLTKGSPVYVEGKLRVEEWTDRDGGQRYTLEVQATDMQFIGSGRSDEAFEDSRDETTFESSSGSDTGVQNTPSDDDIPF